MRVEYSGYTYSIDEQMGKNDLRLSLACTDGETDGCFICATDTPLQDLSQKVLVLATYHTAIADFVEAYSHRDFGLTSHALCSGIRAYLKVG